MAQNHNRNSDDASESHSRIDMGECAFSKSSLNALLRVSGCSGTRWPCGIGNLFPCCTRPKAASDFYDGSYDFYTMYNEKTDKIGKELVTSWSEHVRDMMVLVRHAPLFWYVDMRQCSLHTNRVVYSQQLLRHSLDSHMWHPFSPTPRDLP